MIFTCKQDAQKVIKKMKSSYFHIDWKIESVSQHTQRGRPTQAPEIVGYQVHWQLQRNEAAFEKAVRRKGRFMLGTNSQELSPQEIVLHYKKQSSVECGFRFLKDPWFSVDSFYVKKKKRIVALMMVMALTLFVYNWAQYQLRYES